MPVLDILIRIVNIINMLCRILLVVTQVEKLDATLLDGWSMVEDFFLLDVALEPEILNLAMFLLEQEENHQVITLLLPLLLVTWMKLMVMISPVKESVMLTEMLLQDTPM